MKIGKLYSFLVKFLCSYNLGRYEYNDYWAHNNIKLLNLIFMITV